MAKGYTLDTRRCLYGEPRLSDPQVRVLRRLAEGSADIDPDATARALIHRHWAIEIVNKDVADVPEFICRLTERGRKILAAIDAENACPTNNPEF